MEGYFSGEARSVFQSISTSEGRTLRCLVVLWLLGAVCHGAFDNGTLAAQDHTPCEGAFETEIHLYEATSEAPVPDVSVVLPASQWRGLSDSSGRVMIDRACPGRSTISVAHPAYGNRILEESLRVDSALVVYLASRTVEPDTAVFLLEGITVSVEPVVRRLERRRMATGYRSGVYNASDFEDGVAPVDIAAYVATRTGHPLVGCGSDAPFGEQLCYPYRGGLSRLQALCLDEGTVPGGPSQIQLILQRSDIARVEFYPASGLLRAYTESFMALASNRPWLIRPMPDSC